MKTVKHFEEGWGDCETCGSYSWIKVYYDDGTEDYGDDHLQGRYYELSELVHEVQS